MGTKAVLCMCAAVLLVGCTAANPERKAVPPTEPTANPTVETEEKRSATYTLGEVAKHSTQNDCWLVIGSSVYNVTDFIARHPGGKAILAGCGKDATSLFESKEPHKGPQAQDTLPQLQIGTLKE